MSNKHSEELRKQAQEIAGAGFAGWGNTMQDAADEIDRLHAAKLELLEALRTCGQYSSGITYCDLPKINAALAKHGGQS